MLFEANIIKSSKLLHSYRLEKRNTKKKITTKQDDAYKLFHFSNGKTDYNIFCMTRSELYTINAKLKQGDMKDMNGDSYELFFFCKSISFLETKWILGL